MTEGYTEWPKRNLTVSKMYIKYVRNFFITYEIY
jgi:hypothetical protein